MPDALAGMGGALRGQHERVMGIIATVTRHPRSLGRLSTPAEDTYIATGDFPHVRKATDIANTTAEGAQPAMSGAAQPRHDDFYL